MIPVTKTYLPEFSEYSSRLQHVWESRWVTNHGPSVKELESELKKYLGVRHVFFVTNGTIALQLAIRALDLSGEVITTPFSYVASVSSLVWEHCTPVFVDIDSSSLCLDPKRIEAAITERTSAILPVHVYGNSCDVAAIEAIAKRYHLRVLYDAAHAFGSELNGASLLSFGNVSTVSFHATKLFHTGEGGAVITNDDLLAERISYLMNFGHKGQEAFWGLGMNGKNSELHAALGLAILPKVPELISRRELLSNIYVELFKEASAEVGLRPIRATHLKYNYAYFPVTFSSEETLLQVRDELRKYDIFPRRYFYPCLTALNYVGEQTAPIAEDISRRILCLPLYHDLAEADVKKITSIVIEATHESARKRRTQA